MMDVLKEVMDCQALTMRVRDGIDTLEDKMQNLDIRYLFELYQS